MLDQKMSKTLSDCSKDLGFWLLFSAVVTALIIAIWNYIEGDCVSMWNNEYLSDDGQVEGSGKWRGGPGTSWAGFAFLGIPLVYLLGSIGLVMMMSKSVKIPNANYRYIYLAGMMVITLFIIWVNIFGVWRSVSQF